MSAKLTRPGGKLGDDENFAGMARKIRVNALADDGPPATYYNGQRVEMRPGETLGAAYARQYGQQPTPKPAPAKPPAPSQTSEANFRQQLGELIKHVGAEKATQYVEQGLSLGEALEAELKSREAEKAQLTAAVAADKKREFQDAAGAQLRKINDDLAQLKAEANGEKPKRKGFAGKLRFGGGFRAIGGKHEQRT